ncbi:MAG: sulfatase [Phaeodactylibacter sp.]|nr:sulfatase [Phaeodactylibacter sp.]MCB9048890.1 sulfatase [Lewinellaceae bacterium]
MLRFTTLFLLFALAGGHLPEPPGTLPADTLPNFVFIFADDLGYGDLGCFGATDIYTPNIDRMAAEGVKFTDFYSASSVCSPSRAGLLTGRMPQRMGINGVFFPESFTGMPVEEVTIAQQLKKKGYATGVVGKWHLGHRHKFLPLQRGFDYYYGIPYSNDMASVVYLRGNQVDSFRVDQRYTTRTYTREALHFIEQNQARPFFLYLAHNMPHVPIYASEAFRGTSQRGLYGDVIQELDWSVGQVLDKLEALGLLENTLVVFSSDNGPWLVMEDHGGSAGPLREGKQFTFDGGMRVPTVAMWKGKTPAGTVATDMASQMDWFPTFSNLAGIPLDAHTVFDGRDIAQVLLGTGKREGDSYLFFDGAKLEAYRQGDWKLKLPYEGFEGASWKKAVAPHDTLLINLRENPGETKNLLSAYPEVARQLYESMYREQESLGALPPSLVLRTPADNSHYEYLESKRKE